LRRREGDPGEDRPRETTTRPAQGSEPGAECVKGAARHGAVEVRGGACRPLTRNARLRGSEPGVSCFWRRGAMRFVRRTRKIPNLLSIRTKHFLAMS
jgi:hypothetical protein